MGVDKLNFCGLIGENIQYSKSPIIHNKFYKQNNIQLEYKIFDLKKDDLPYFIENLNKNKIVGFNVTIPFKEIIMKHLTKVDFMAERIGAVNTVVVNQDELTGYNTDYYGFIDSLKGINTKGCAVLIIGNGGSARCVYYALKDLGVGVISCLARNKAKAIIQMPDDCNVLEIGYEIQFSRYDLIINCTPLGGANYREASPVVLKDIRQDVLVYDLNYIPNTSKLLMKAKELGALTKNGDEMLNYQADYTIKIWCSNLYKGGKYIESFKWIIRNNN